MRFALAFCFWALAGFSPAPLLAQEQTEPAMRSEILVIDPNKLFANTMFGKRISAEIEQEGQQLANENRALEQQLRDEEKALTDQRPVMDPAAFRDAADAFDARVQAIRRERAEKARALEEKRANAEQRFLSTAQGILIELVNERGGTMLLDIRSVLLRDEDIDITNDAVARIDATLGTGEGLEEQGSVPAD